MVEIIGGVLTAIALMWHFEPSLYKLEKGLAAYADRHSWT